ncbi:MAG: hypothetical protein JO104_02460 [Candidatus Eremiobacteraeota bacterium]|nr:hypothetical protein [Candidatus Eremiobacteraeota bacterium]
MKLAAVPLALLGLAGVAPGPQPTAPLAPARTAAEVLARVAGTQTPLTSFAVPVTIGGSVRVSFLSVPFNVHGTQYFAAPNKQAMHLTDAPSVAQGFQNAVSTMGTPQTWAYTYDITLQGTQQRHKHFAYVLVGIPKRSSNVKSFTMLVGEKSSAVESVDFSYTNGASLAVEFSHHHAHPYHLPTSATIAAHFPQYSGTATVEYGAYQLNVPVPDSVFQKQ